MYRSGIGVGEIAKEVGMSYKGIRDRLIKLGVYKGRDKR